jgi:hypothetical protein
VQGVYDVRADVAGASGYEPGHVTGNDQAIPATVACRLGDRRT